jgi:hypothetical protein
MYRDNPWRLSGGKCRDPWLLWWPNRPHLWRWIGIAGREESMAGLVASLMGGRRAGWNDVGRLVMVHFICYWGEF